MFRTTRAFRNVFKMFAQILPSATLHVRISCCNSQINSKNQGRRDVRTGEKQKDLRRRLHASVRMEVLKALPFEKFGAIIDQCYVIDTKV